MSKMYLYGGEQDGLEVPISEADRPNVFYTVPNNEKPKVEGVKGKQAKMDMRDKLATMAYEFVPGASDTDHFVMRRNPALDKVAQI